MNVGLNSVQCDRHGITGNCCLGCFEEMRDKARRLRECLQSHLAFELADTEEGIEASGLSWPKTQELLKEITVKELG